MPHKLLERKHQQQAQRRHENNLRQEFYERTAKYFERESVATRRFSSWQRRSAESYSSWITKKQKEERLEERRCKLRELLAAEDDLYKRELEERSSRLSSRRSDSVISLDDLRRKLIENRAERSLYYPDTCRRMKPIAQESNGSSDRPAAGFSTKDREDREDRVDFARMNPVTQGSSESSDRPAAGFSSQDREDRENRADAARMKPIAQESNGSGDRPAAGLSSRDREDRPDSASTERHIHFSGPLSLDKLSIQSESDDVHRPSVCRNNSELTFSSPQRNLRFASRPSQPSLSNTNIRDCDMEDWSSYSFQEAISEYGEDTHNKQQNKESCESENGNQVHSTNQDVEQIDSCTRSQQSHCETTPSNHDNVSVDNRSESQEAQEEHESDKDILELDISKVGLESIDPSLQLYRYLKHKDLKQQILDLCNREHIFVVKQAWDEALRLREIRNELILLKNRNLYENQDLNIDKKIRTSALKIIEAREALHQKRIKMCNSMIYSDEARDLWKQWVKEDDNLAKLETTATRDLFQSKLEDEWKNLAICDKQRLSQLYDRVMQRSDLQNEHKLAAAFRDANKHQMQYSKHTEDQ